MPNRCGGFTGGRARRHSDEAAITLRSSERSQLSVLAAKHSGWGTFFGCLPPRPPRWPVVPIYPNAVILPFFLSLSVLLISLLLLLLLPGVSLIQKAKQSLWILRMQEVHSDENIMSDRFDCKNCSESLYGRKYIPVEDNPHCIPCYDRLHANTCQECKEIIGHNTRVGPEFTPVERAK